MPRHQSQLSARVAGPPPRPRRRRLSHIAVNTAKATCSEGKAFPDASTALRKASDPACDGSTSGGGTVVGQRMKTTKPAALRTTAAAAYEASALPDTRSDGAR